MMTTSHPAAELQAMYRRGEINADEYALAKKYLNETTTTTQAQTNASLEAKVQSFVRNHPFLVVAGAIGLYLAYSHSGISMGSGGKSLNEPEPVSCFSAWDGSATSLVEAVKRDLRDPDSFQHIETRYNDKDPNILRVRMEYRAKNGFGGYNKEVAYGQMVKSTCILFSRDP